MNSGLEDVIAAETVLSHSDDERGISRDAFTPVFAIARCGGWLAHAMEQQKTGRLIRPISAYTGRFPRGTRPGRRPMTGRLAALPMRFMFDFGGPIAVVRVDASFSVFPAAVA